MDAKPLSARMVMEVGSQRYNVICEWADEVAALESRVAAMREATQPLLDAYLRARGEPGLVYIAPYMSALELTLRQAAAKDGST